MKRFLRLLQDLKWAALTFVLLTLMVSCGISKKNFEEIRSASEKVAVDPVTDRVIERAKTFADTPTSTAALLPKEWTAPDLFILLTYLRTFRCRARPGECPNWGKD